MLEDDVKSLNYGSYHAEILIPYSSGSESGAPPCVCVCVF